MARQLKRLTTRTVASLTKPGRHADGGCLYCTISRTTDGLSKRWTFLFMLDGKQREAGFGSVSTVTLSEAREKATQYRSLLTRGCCPLAAKQASKDAEKARRTFGQCADEFIKSKRSEWRSATHAHQWAMTLETYCMPIWSLPVDAVDTAGVLKVLKPIWGKIPETASRLRGRIEAVLDYAKAHKLRAGENPAAWKGNLANILPKRQKVSRGHHAAMPYRDVPEFIGKVRNTESIPAMALEFTILTAARVGEVLGARWDEIDVNTKVWTIPATRMKSGIEHRVPLPSRAVEIIETLGKYRTGDFIFPGHRLGQPIGYTSVRKEGRGEATVHGFRSSFRDWCGEETSFPREVAEQALAHATGNTVEQAYRRGDALEKRRALMEAWAAYCGPTASGNVIALTRPAGVAL